MVAQQHGRSGGDGAHGEHITTETLRTQRLLVFRALCASVVNILCALRLLCARTYEIHFAVALALTLALLVGTPRAQAPSSTAETLHILVTNDDGVRAAGILALAQTLRSVGDITI